MHTDLYRLTRLQSLVSLSVLLHFGKYQNILALVKISSISNVVKFVFEELHFVFKYELGNQAQDVIENRMD